MEGLSLGSVGQSQQITSFFLVGHPECHYDPSQTNLTSLNESDLEHKALKESHDPRWVREELRRGKLHPIQNVEGEEICLQDKQTCKTAKMHDKSQQEELVCQQKETQDDIDAAVALVALLKACGEQKDLPEGNRIYAEIVSRGLLEKNVFVGSTLVSMYAK
eukprot:c16257_g1_i1 orf=1-483(-)